MTFYEFLVRGLGKVYSYINPNSFYKNDDSSFDYSDQAANDYIKKLILDNNDGLLITKFGTYELSALLYFYRGHKGIKSFYDGVRNNRIVFEKPLVTRLCNNAGFFPGNIELIKKFADLYYENISEIDVLGSYMKSEAYIDDELKNAVKVNLEGYYAPFKWDNPWTEALSGKKVLVIHPFIDSIAKQYERRDKLFKDSRVLPEFADLQLIKAVQSIAGNEPDGNFSTWFDALESMEQQIAKKDFDVALIGCGAYGFPLAAYVKKLGKTAVQLSGWTQMLFGIYGSRWIQDQPEYAKFVNEYWIRPGEEERPKNLEKVENGCYW